VWAANVLVPGAGLVLAGRVGVGVLWGGLWLALAGGYLATVILRPEAGLLRSALAVPALLWYLGGQVLLAYRLRESDRAAADERRQVRFRQALEAYLQGRLDEAEELCDRLLAADPDDVEATLQLASIARRRGQIERAGRLLRRGRYLDDEGRWDFEIDRELAALTAGTGAVPQGPVFAESGPAKPEA
jgi:tetratricopeptide (TPR) repeat protein